MKQKILVLFIILFFSISSLSLINIAKCGSADTYSTVTTGLTFNGLTSNQGVYANCAGFNIFASDKELIFYDSSGATAKTWSLTNPSSLTDVNDITCRITNYNSSCILVIESYDFNYGGYSTLIYFYAYFLNVNTLVSQTVTSQTFIDGSNYQALLYDLQIINNSGSYYALLSIKLHSSYYVKIIELSPTIAVNSISSTISTITYNPTVIISSGTTNIFYVITLSNSGTNRYEIFKLNVVTPSLTDIGTGGNNNDYSSSYVYVIDYAYDTTNIANSYYDVLISYSYSTAGNIGVRLIRFNDTYIYDYAFSNSVSSYPVNIIRCLGALLPFSATGINDLRDGQYAYYYVGATLSWGIDASTIQKIGLGIYDLLTGHTYSYSYTASTPYITCMQGFEINGLTTETPSFNVSPPSAYGNNGSPYQLYFTTSNNVGGLQSLGSNIMFMIDYQNGKAVSDLQTSLNPNWVYTYVVSPNPISELNNNIELSQGIGYTYNGYLFINSVQNGSGAYTVQITSLITTSSSWIHSSLFMSSLVNPIYLGVLIYGDTLAQISNIVNTHVAPLGNPVINSSFSGGNINFYISQVLSSQMTFRVLQLNVTLDSGSGGGSFTETYVIQYDYSGATSQNGYLSTPTNNGNGNGGNNNGITTTLPIIPKGYETETAIIIYLISISGLIGAFYYLHNTNVPFAVCLGLIIATIICNVVNVLGVYTYPIDAVTIISIVGILIFMRH